MAEREPPEATQKATRDFKKKERARVEVPRREHVLESDDGEGRWFLEGVPWCAVMGSRQGSSAGRIRRVPLREPRSSGQEEALLSGLTLADGDQKFHKWSSLVSP